MKHHEAEMAIIGGILTDNEQYNLVVEEISAQDFQDERGATCFNAIVKLYEANTGIDIVTILNAIKPSDVEDYKTYLRYCENLVPSIPNTQEYCRIVKEASVRRKVSEIANQANTELNQGGDIDNVIDSLTNSIMGLSTSNQVSVKTISNTIESSLNRIDNIVAGKEEVGILTNIKGLDDILFGLHPSDLIILGARPSVGKTSLATSIALNIARQGKAVAIFSLEMSTEQLNDRILSMDSQVPLSTIRNPAVNGVKVITEQDYNALKSSVERLKSLNIVIDDTASISISELKKRCRRLHKQHSLSLIVIDYIGLMKSRRDTGDPVRDVTEISRELKLLAKSLKVPVLALSQLNRGLESRDDKMPRLSDLRDSGAIEQDADVVMFIAGYAKSEDYLSKTQYEYERLVEISIAKHRNGALGIAQLIFNANTTEFYTPIK